MEFIRQTYGHSVGGPDDAGELWTVDGGSRVTAYFELS